MPALAVAVPNRLDERGGVVMGPKGRGLAAEGWTAPGLPEAEFVESRCHGEGLDLLIVARFGFGGRDVADGLEQAAVVEPIHPVEGGELNLLQRAPGSPAPDDLGLVEAVDRLGQGVVVAVADAADRGLDARIGEALGVADRDVLDSRSL